MSNYYTRSVVHVSRKFVKHYFASNAILKFALENVWLAFVCRSNCHLIHSVAMQGLLDDNQIIAGAMKICCQVASCPTFLQSGYNMYLQRTRIYNILFRCVCDAVVKSRPKFVTECTRPLKCTPMRKKTFKSLQRFSSPVRCSFSLSCGYNRWRMQFDAEEKQSHLGGQVQMGLNDSRATPPW